MTALVDRRRLASEASGGHSADLVYRIFLELVLKKDLRGNVLDFGAGTGTLTKDVWRLGRFLSVSGADLMARPTGLPPEIRWASLDLNEPTQFPSESFNVVLAAEIIEHLENPRGVAREWFRLLRPGGTLILSTPNNETWRALIALVFRGHFVGFGERNYPAHITALLRTDLMRVLIEAGFRAPVFVYTDHGGVPKFPRVTWQAVSFGLLRGRRFSDNVLAVASKPG